MLLDIHQKSRQPNTSSSFGAKLDLSYLVKLQLGESLTDKQTISFHSLDTNSVFWQKIDTETIYRTRANNRRSWIEAAPIELV